MVVSVSCVISGGGGGEPDKDLGGRPFGPHTARAIAEKTLKSILRHREGAGLDRSFSSAQKEEKKDVCIRSGVRRDRIPHPNARRSHKKWT